MEDDRDLVVVTPAYRLLLPRRLDHACTNLGLFSDWAPGDLGSSPERPHYAYEVQLVPATTYRA